MGNIEPVEKNMYAFLRNAKAELTLNQSKQFSSKTADKNQKENIS